MKTAQRLEYVQGSVERVTFHSEATGFCVLRTQVRGHRDVVTVIGNAASITAGEYIECQGLWVNDRTHGMQFKAEHLKAIQPTTLEGIQKYLGSGMVKGIGPHFAKKLVAAFGEAVFDVIEQSPERLLDLEGIGPKRQSRVASAWAEQKAIRSIMVFLHSHGVGTARAVRIYKTYGDESVEIVKANPYRLARDIRGIGFKTADQLAEKLGIAKDSLMRAQAGASHVLQELCDKGNCAAELSKLLEAAHKLLEIPEEVIQTGIEQEILENQLVKDNINDVPCIYPISLYTAETRAAAQLKRLNTTHVPWGEIDAAKAIPTIEKKTGLALSDSQHEAVEQILKSKISIMTGGPGVGKTTIVKSLLGIIEDKALRINLCAPTGRAAKRLTETTQLEAKTIHRLLEFDMKTYGFKHNQNNLLDLDVLIIDEASMIDIVLLNHLLKALPLDAAVIFVGDIDQLPSVGSGAVLADMIASKTITTVRLTEIFRQAAHSHIIVNAHRVNQGKMPIPHDSPKSDFFTLYADTPEEIHDKLLEVVINRLPKRYGYDPIRDIQILTPMNRGGLGSRSLNAALQARLNGRAEPKIERFGSIYAPGDKVIQMTNNYDKDVFNGDIGVIESIDLDEDEVKIKFDYQIKTYGINELDEINLAYAISIHKAQGSEFPVVVMPLATQHFALLARNLVYTGITRGKSRVVLIGQKKAIGMAVHNDKEAHRLTKLAERLA
ncbi:MAG: ATP-dependent RecD-like DNA helicase [Legionellaceae bacterium]|nr:ATP-dependent RecD-like DNA helicase [Legionellaceae bacterium]